MVWLAHHSIQNIHSIPTKTLGAIIFIFPEGRLSQHVCRDTWNLFPSSAPSQKKRVPVLLWCCIFFSYFSRKKKNSTQHNTTLEQERKHRCHLLLYGCQKTWGYPNHDYHDFQNCYGRIIFHGIKKNISTIKKWDNKQNKSISTKIIKSAEGWGERIPSSIQPESTN